MLKINNALIFDDEVNLITDQQTTITINNSSYKSLINLHNYFLNNSIPISIINDLAISPGDALDKISNLPKPDIVVMDLDLNSDGEVGEDDINLIGLALKKIYENFGDYILFIYSSQSDEWENIMPKILVENEDLANILDINNTIIFEKFIESSVTINERIAVEIEKKKERYFKNMLVKVDNILSGMWNKETKVVCIMTIAVFFVVYFSIPNIDYSLLFFSIIIVILTTYKFILSNKLIK